MNRLEHFKEARKSRRKYVLSVSLLLIMVVTGFCIIDYSINSLMKNEKRISLVSYQYINEDRIEVNVLNNKFLVNISYIRRDFEKIRNMFGNIGNFE